MDWKYLSTVIVHRLMAGQSGIDCREEIEGGASSRYALNNIDLNRNFPDYLNQSLSEPIRAPETNAIMSWIDRVPFVLSCRRDNDRLK